MKRRLWLLALPLAAAAVWLLGRAPTDHAVGRLCAVFQEERRERERPLRAEISRLEADPGAAETVAGLRRAYQESFLAVRERSVRGWSLLLIPPGAARPEPEDYLVLGRIDPSTPDDPPLLQGPVEVWIAPRGPLARLLRRLGLAP